LMHEPAGNEGGTNTELVLGPGRTWPGENQNKPKLQAEVHVIRYPSQADFVQFDFKVRVYAFIWGPGAPHARHPREEAGDPQGSENAKVAY